MMKIGVLDCNNFFVSCERVFRADLKNKPVVVLSGNDGCVVARSQEIKDMGIAMGVPYFQIKDILKEAGATVFSSNFALYRDISFRVFEIIKSEIDNIEPYSIDECFFLTSENELDRLSKLKVRIEKEVGIPVSVGVAASKTQAKYVNRVAKRTHKIEVWNQEKWCREVKNIRLSEIWGVGRSHMQSFIKLGLQTVEDYINLPENFIRVNFGVNGERLYWELKGVSALAVDSSIKQQKSLMSSRSLATATDKYEIVESEIIGHIHSVATDLLGSNLVAKTLCVYVYPSRYGDFLMQGFSREVSFDLATNDLFLLTKEGIKLLKDTYKNGVPYKKIGVIVSGLRPSDSVSETLFSDKSSKKTQELSDLIFAINTKYKKGLELGRLPKGFESRMINKKHLSPAYTTKWTELKTVKA
ncbi:MAG: hypothetical protein KBC78_00560 [Candidatus Pacebacteria bacterium]|nr:hypothetical protein [Candidatus Paceibacterota bacterium]